MARVTRRQFIKTYGRRPARRLDCSPSPAPRLAARCWGPTTRCASAWPASTAGAIAHRRLCRRAERQNVQVTYLIDPDTRLFDVAQRRWSASRAATTPQVRVRTSARRWRTRTSTPSRVATCNHWHSLITIWACQAGKDVYVEKPCSHNVFEGRKCVEAAAQVRPHRAARHAAAQQPKRATRDRGRRSRASTASCWSRRATAASRGGASASKTPEAPPAGFDFNIWLGPAPEQPYHDEPGPLQLALVLGHRQRRHRQPGRARDGRRPLGHQGRHAAQERVEPGRRGSRYKDQGQTPNMQMAVFDLRRRAAGVRSPRPGRRQDAALPNKVANEFYTTEGVIRDGKFYRNGEEPGEKVEGPEVSVTPGGPFGSFIRPSAAASPRTSMPTPKWPTTRPRCATWRNISYRLGQPVPFNKASQSLGDDKQVVETFNNLGENLKAVGMKLDDTTYTLGKTLHVRRRQPKSSPAKGPTRPTRCCRATTARRSWCRASVRLRCR